MPLIGKIIPALSAWKKQVKDNLFSSTIGAILAVGILVTAPSMGVFWWVPILSLILTRFLVISKNRNKDDEHYIITSWKKMLLDFIRDFLPLIITFGCAFIIMLFGLLQFLGVEALVSASSGIVKIGCVFWVLSGLASIFYVCVNLFFVD